VKIESEQNYDDGAAASLSLGAEHSEGVQQQATTALQFGEGLGGALRPQRPWSPPAREEPAPRSPSPVMRPPLQELAEETPLALRERRWRGRKSNRK
jgi:hypothetical protein